MKFENAEKSPCSVCPLRQFAFCGALMRAWPNAPLPYDHRTAPARDNIYMAGEPTDNVLVICGGWAARVMRLPDGRRQILSYLLPGDIISTESLFRDSLNYHVQSLTEVRYARIRREDVATGLKRDSALLDFIADMMCKEKEEADELLADIGRRVADERIARLILRLIRRMSARGLVHGDSFAFPLRQQHIADTVGLTPVHVSRIISALRKQNILSVDRGEIRIIDRPRFLDVARIRPRERKGVLGL